MDPCKFIKFNHKEHRVNYTKVAKSYLNEIYKCYSYFSLSPLCNFLVNSVVKL